MWIKGSPHFKIPIPPLNLQIVNTHKQIWDQNEIRLNIDIWWFDNPAPMELTSPSLFQTPIPS